MWGTHSSSQYWSGGDVRELMWHTQAVRTGRELMWGSWYETLKQSELVGSWCEGADMRHSGSQNWSGADVINAQKWVKKVHCTYFRSSSWCDRELRRNSCFTWEQRRDSGWPPTGKCKCFFPLKQQEIWDFFSLFGWVDLTSRGLHKNLHFFLRKKALVEISSKIMSLDEIWILGYPLPPLLPGNLLHFDDFFVIIGTKNHQNL